MKVALLAATCRKLQVLKAFLKFPYTLVHLVHLLTLIKMLGVLDASKATYMYSL